MKESLAAGLLIEAGWLGRVQDLRRRDKADGSDDDDGGSDHIMNGEKPRRLRFLDPMAGSGSLVLEATMMAADIAPGLMRIRCGLPNAGAPPVTRWKSTSGADEDQPTTIWKRVLLEATQRAKTGIQAMRQNPSQIQILANDIHPGAVNIMESALSSAGLSDFVQVTNMDCFDLDVVVDEGEEGEMGVSCVVATNPPWGVRLTDDVAESWEALRHFVRDKCPNGTVVFVLSGDRAAPVTLKLKRDRMIPIRTGDQDLRWIQYTIGRGTIQGSSNDYGGSDSLKTADRIDVNARKTDSTRSPKSPVAATTAKSERNEWL
jgi:putative N6-adenine-specific DNA methylase